jgi:hypothetical protein
MSEADVKKKVVNLVWSTQQGYRDEKRFVTPEDLRVLREIYETKKPVKKGFLIYIGELT